MSSVLKYPNGPLGWVATPIDFTGDNILGVSTQEAIQRYTLGTRYIMWDGSTYRYCLAGSSPNADVTGVLVTDRGAKNLDTQAIMWAAVVGTSYAGTYVVSVTVAATDGLVAGGSTEAIAADALVGGYICLNIAGIQKNSQTCNIVGNTATASGGGTMQITLAQPLRSNVTTTTTVEVMGSPYHNVNSFGQAGGAYEAVVVVPEMPATTGQYFWGKTYGPKCLIAEAIVGTVGHGQQLIFRHNGTVGVHNHAGDQGGITYTAYAQHAGYVLCTSNIATGQQGAPWVMLQIGQ